jgi:hypothetical protein
MNKVIRTTELIEKIKSMVDLSLEDLRDFTISELETLCLSFGPSDRQRILLALEESFVFSGYATFVSETDHNWLASIEVKHDLRLRRTLGVPDAVVQESDWESSLEDAFLRLKTTAKNGRAS